MRKGRRCAFGCRQGAISIGNHCSVCTYMRGGRLQPGCGEGSRIRTATTKQAEKTRERRRLLPNHFPSGDAPLSNAGGPRVSKPPPAALHETRRRGQDLSGPSRTPPPARLVFSRSWRTGGCSTLASRSSIFFSRLVRWISRACAVFSPLHGVVRPG